MSDVPLLRNPTTRVLTADDGTTISYAVFDGAEPPVVVLHGLAGSGREHVPTAHALAGRQVLLVDQRGHGASTRVPHDVSREAYVRDVAQVIEHHGAAPVDLVGQSMGAHTAMLTAAARPDLVRRLVLLECDEGSGTPSDQASLGDYFRSWPTPFPSRAAATAFLGSGPLAQAWAADLEERAGGLYPRFDADVMQAAITAVAAPRWAEWESVRAPTLLVYADGGMFTEDQKSAFAARGRHVTRVDLPNASHDAHLDAFDAWVAVLTEFLEADAV